MHFGVLNYETEHKEGSCKVSGRSVVFLAFYADFFLCPKLVIITTLNVKDIAGWTQDLLILKRFYIRKEQRLICVAK